MFVIVAVQNEYKFANKNFNNKGKKKKKFAQKGKKYCLRVTKFSLVVVPQFCTLHCLKGVNKLEL